jgi:amino-acid N-acetyltransferase
MKVDTNKLSGGACVNIRKAILGDIEGIYNLVDYYAERGLILPRSRHSIFETLRDFTVAERDGKILGTCALTLAWDGLAEVRALTVSPQHLRSGVGLKLVAAAVAEAKQLGVSNLFVLTYHPKFFAAAGFLEISKEELPHKVWRDCINCSKFPNCDETAMTLQL